jgi:8-oxo-dGTP diphosphatase
VNQIPRVGIGVFVWKNGAFLMGQRRGAHGNNSWSVPGGHLEYLESWEACAAREVLEETGMEITNIRFLTATNDLFTEEGKHYVTIWMQSDWQKNEPRILEPDKFVRMEWRNFSDLPEPLFLPWQQLRRAQPGLFTGTSQQI